MKIAPVMFTASNKISNKGQGGVNKSVNPYEGMGADVYMRLAYASTKDARIERELKSMNLIG